MLKRERHLIKKTDMEKIEILVENGISMIFQELKHFEKRFVTLTIDELELILKTAKELNIKV